MANVDQLLDKAVSLITDYVNDSSHGYDQTSRWGPNYDCSSLVITIYQNVGVKVKDAGATYTGNMKPAFLKCGFKDITSSVNLSTGSGLKPGDVLLNIVNHTAMYIGNGKVAQASGNEKGTITGGQSGDQTGKELNISPYHNFPWDCVLRLSGENEVDESTSVPTTYATHTIKKGDTLWKLAKQYYGNSTMYKQLASINGIEPTSVLRIGQVLKVPSTSGSTVTPAITTEKFNIELTTLQEGDKGDSVRALQLLLIGNGYPCGKHNDDGDFGSDTKSALEKFQRENNLTVTGRTDSKTMTALLE